MRKAQATTFIQEKKEFWHFKYIFKHLLNHNPLISKTMLEFRVMILILSLAKIVN